MIAMIEGQIQRQDPVNEVDVQLELLSHRRQARSAARRQRGPRKVIRVLQGGRIKIKDEDN